MLFGLAKVGAEKAGRVAYHRTIDGLKLGSYLLPDESFDQWAEQLEEGGWWPGSEHADVLRQMFTEAWVDEAFMYEERHAEIIRRYAARTAAID